MKLSLALAGAVMLGAALTGCGGNSGESSDYCADVRDASSTFGDLSSGKAAQLDPAFATFHKLADEAPTEIQGDWDKLDGAITTVEKSLKDAGLTFSDFDKIKQGQMPKGVDVSQLTALAAQFQKLNSPEFSKASKNIEAHAKETCKVDLNAS